MPQFDGLFDYQNRVRPSYLRSNLLSRRLPRGFTEADVLPRLRSRAFAGRGCATPDVESDAPGTSRGRLFRSNLSLPDLPKDMRFVTSFSTRPGRTDDETRGLATGPFMNLESGPNSVQLQSGALGCPLLVIRIAGVGAFHAALRLPWVHGLGWNVGGLHGDDCPRHACRLRVGC